MKEQKEGRKLIFRKAKLKDADELSKLRRNSFGKIKGENYNIDLIKLLKKKNTPEEMKRKMNDYKMFCLLKNNKIIGTISLDNDEIKGVFVRYNYTRKGIGTILMDNIENYARKNKIKKLHLYSAEKARGFYKKLGYKIVRKIEKPWEGIKNINFLMEKRI